MRYNNRQGFTLIEILVVVTLTIMVMGMIFVPLVQSLKITRTAEIMIRAQDGARFALSSVSKDLSNAMFVFDNTRDPIYFPVRDTSGQLVNVPVYYAKVDILLPKMRWYCPVNATHTPGVWSGPEEAAPCCAEPTCGAELVLKPIEPLTQDFTIVRYFVGLRDPTMPYDNGYEKRRSQILTDAGNDNMFVLYRVEFDPHDLSLFPRDGSGNPRNPEYNRQDPGFFYDTAMNPHGVSYAEAWRRICRPAAAVEDVDLATIKYGNAGEPPVVSSTVRFTPTAVYNDPLTPTSSPDGKSPATTFKASYGNWVLPYKVTLEPMSEEGVTYVTMPGLGINSDEDPPTDMCIYRFDRPNPKNPLPFVFNITHYQESKFDGTKDTSVYGVGEILPSSLLDRERAFTVDPAKGTVSFAFPNVYETYCNALNERVRTHFGSPNVSIALSEVVGSDAVGPGGMLLINSAPAGSGLDPRVLPNATVVPGSVRVMAPDAHLGTGSRWVNDNSHPLTTYSSTPTMTSDPGVNQFSVDAAHDADTFGVPTPGAAAVYFSRPKTIAGSPAVLPTSHPGYSGNDNILLYYEVQNNKKDDILRASYITKSVITVQVGMRIYDSGTGRAQIANLSNKVRLKNAAP